MKTKSRFLIQAFAVVALIASVLGLNLQSLNARAQTTNLAAGKPVTCSANPQFPCAEAVDANPGTRWASAAAIDPQFIYVDLGNTYNVTSVKLVWEAAYATAFQIQVSSDATTWTNVYTTTTGTGGTQTLTVSGTGRYVRMNGTARATQWGYSLWEFEVYGTLASGPTATFTRTSTAGPTSTRTNTPVGPTATFTRTATASAGCGTSNISLGKTATASSALGGNTAAMAIDGNTGTRWESTQGVDPQWIYVDLGSTQNICRVVLRWEGAYASTYQIQTSNDASSWTTIYSTTTGDGGVDDLTVSGTGRYVRMNGTARGTQWGYSIFEFEIYNGTSGPTPTTPPGSTPTRTVTPSITPTQSAGVCTQPNVPNFGSNVRIFDPGMSAASIQALLDADFEAMKSTQTAQFSETRRAHLFKPGTYNVYDNVGFYLSVAGLGINPGDVTINGAVTVDAFNASDAGNATQNFWRSAENLTINTNGGANRWGVAQAAPFRRINVLGGLNLYPASYGWASGGYTSDVRTTGLVASASQQQWYSKDSNYGGGWDGAVWNMVFSGVVGAPAASFPASPKTVLGTTPVSRDVPYLYIDASGNYRVFLPNLRTNASGASWPNTPGTSLPMSQFYVVQPGTSAATINSMLAQNCNLFFTPGIFHITQPINVTRANTVVLGIGYPTIVNDGGTVAMQVGDVDGVRVKGILFDAGLTAAQAQLIVGTQGNATSHASNPITLQDVFFRVGGQFAGKTINSLVVNANDTIIDHTWIWRADHGAGVGWTVNTAETGLIVNGNNVLATGLFVEHYQKYQVIWNGQNGKTIFFQNEIGYDMPNQAAWMNGSTRGYAAYKVANNVTTHEAWGLGSYIFLNVDTSIWGDRAFEVPNTAGVKFHNISTVSLGNAGMIQWVINTTGATTPTNSTPATVTNYP